MRAVAASNVGEDMAERQLLAFYLLQRIGRTVVAASTCCATPIAAAFDQPVLLNELLKAGCSAGLRDFGSQSARQRSPAGGGV